MTGQLSLFGGAAPPATARPIYATPQPCGCCPAVGLIYGRSYTDGVPVDHCAACTAAEVRRLRAAGAWVSDSYGWVV